MSKKILITGANGGFGNLIALTLIGNGHTVVASMRGIDTKNSSAAAEFKKAGAHVVEIDVTHDDSVHQGVTAAVEMADGIDVVVNNAGVGVIGLQETFTPEDWQKIFDVNLFGVQRVNRAILPHMRSRKSGLLIFISSLLGRFTIPFYGPYNASKWALEAMAENYRVELSGFGVDACLVEPGGYPTSFMDNLVKPGDSSRDSGYGDLAQVPSQFLNTFEKALANKPEQNPQDVADAVSDLIARPAGQRPFRTVVDKMGMGDHLKGYNDQLEQITSGIYHAFGMEDMLKLKV